MAFLRSLVVAAVAVVLTGVATPVRAAATLVPVSGFGSNPGALRMYGYVPDGLPAGRPVVVALHACTQSAADYFEHSGWPAYADRYSAALVFPEQTAANNPLSCFNWFTAGDTGRGGGEALSIKQMVDYALAHYGSDPHRVFVTGLSAGGAMTAALLAAYPDVFAGGAVVAGLPYGCTVVCQYVPQNRTPAQWGDAVRAANPGYAGPWPRVAIWYGTADTIVPPVNATDLRDQWTDVWGIAPTPSGSTNLPGRTTAEAYADASGRTAVQLYRVPDIGHGTPVDPGPAENQCGSTGTYYPASICSSYYTAAFWGLAD